MKRFIIGALFVGNLAVCTDNPPETGKSKPEETEEKIDHQDFLPSVIKREKIEKKKEVAVSSKQNSETVKDRVSLSLVCCKNNVCQVKDVRKINVLPGINKKIFTNLYPGLTEESPVFHIPKNKKISVLSYEFCRKNSSRGDFLRSAVGNEVFFKVDKNDKLEKGVLSNILNENGSLLATIKDGNRYFLIPADNCAAVEAKTDFNDSDTLQVFLESADAADTALEINYMTSNINWKHLCRINVSEDLRVGEVSSEALLKNNTDSDLENIKIAFDFFEPSLNRINSRSNMSSTFNLSIKKNSCSTCVLKSLKEQKIKLEYVAKISTDILIGDVAKEIPVGNLLIIDAVGKLGVGTDFTGSELFIYQQLSDGQRFLGQHALSSFIKNDAFVIEMGTTDDVVAQVQQTDFRKLSEKQSEYGIRVSLQNKKTTESDVCVVLDINSAWKVIKKNADMYPDSKPSWKLNLNPGESKELHFRIRIDN